MIDTPQADGLYATQGARRGLRDARPKRMWQQDAGVHLLWTCLCATLLVLQPYKFAARPNHCLCGESRQRKPCS